MKKTAAILILLILAGIAPAQENFVEKLNHAALSYLNQRQPGNSIMDVESLTDSRNVTVGYIFHFIPDGFMIVSASGKIAPVYAYSTDGNFILPFPEGKNLKERIAEDLTLRVAASDHFTPAEQTAVMQEWILFMEGSSPHVPFQQWPEPGTTPTEGWICTNWTQSAPYNMMCPMDLNAGSRSVAGCPAIAMAQILNYHEDINGTRFNDGDDYYHAYGSGNSYWIDDDWQAQDFPCFDTLNFWLDSLELIYGLHETPSNPLKAALCFACGVAAQQVYSASVSGTFGLDQAIMAFQRFGFVEANLIFPDDTTLNTQIAENIKVALPVQLGLLVSTGSGGHNVVVDGYNTEEFYHFNFGWGGSANGWYTLPPVTIPYNLTIIEGAIVDIKSSQYTNLPRNIQDFQTIHLYPNPFKTELAIEGVNGQATFNLYDLTGKKLLETVLGGSKLILPGNEIPSGIYIYRISDHSGRSIQGKLIKE